MFERPDLYDKYPDPEVILGDFAAGLAAVILRKVLKCWREMPH